MNTRDAIEAGIGGFSNVVKRFTGLRTREVGEMDMEEQLKKTNPKAYDEMKRDQKRYDDDTKRRHTIKSRKALRASYVSIILKYYFQRSFFIIQLLHHIFIYTNKST